MPDFSDEQRYPDLKLRQYVADRAASLSYRVEARAELARREQKRSTPGDVADMELEALNRSERVRKVQGHGTNE